MMYFILTHIYIEKKFPNRYSLDYQTAILVLIQHFFCKIFSRLHAYATGLYENDCSRVMLAKALSFHFHLDIK